MPRIEFIRPDWLAPDSVRAVSTTRIGGVSQGPFASLNLGDRVEDDQEAVAENRWRLKTQAGLPAAPVWLNQVHGNRVIELDAPGQDLQADAMIVRRPGQVCAVLTADCLPVLLCERNGAAVAAVHCGWRGLAAGILEAAVSRLNFAGEELLAWMGPAIGPESFEVGEEVREAFLRHDPETSACFTSTTQRGKYFADIYALAGRRLGQLGVSQVYGGGYCTRTDERRFFSYRRDGVCGRMASLIWMRK